MALHGGDGGGDGAPVVDLAAPGEPATKNEDRNLQNQIS